MNRIELIRQLLAADAALKTNCDAYTVFVVLKDGPNTILDIESTYGLDNGTLYIRVEKKP